MFVRLCSARCSMIPFMVISSCIRFSSKSLTHLSSRDYETSSSLEGAILFSPEHPTIALNTQSGMTSCFQIDTVMCLKLFIHKSNEGNTGLQ